MMTNILHNADCLEILKQMPDNSIDAIVTDPPYGMSNHKQQDIENALQAWLSGNEYSHGSKGFMGKEWDSFVPSPTIWRECLRVLKHGGHLLAFASTRTSDLMGISLRLAGFEIRDSVYWIHGQGFPKSVDISKAIDKAAGAEREVVRLSHHAAKRSSSILGQGAKQDIEIDKRELTDPATESAKQWQGMGTALKPAVEPVILARKPIEKGLTIAENCLKWGTGGLSIDDCRVPSEGVPVFNNGVDNGDKNRSSYDTGGSNRTGEISHQGRFPANLIHSGEPCVLELFPYTKSGECKPEHNVALNKKSCFGNTKYNATSQKSEGSAARFFYCAKPSPRERNEGLDGFEDKEVRTTYDKTVRDNNGNDSGYSRKNHHPTIKSIALMQYLVKLISREGQTVLDPFIGSGTTGIACKNLNRSFIGIEREPEYFEIAKARIKNAK